MGIDAASTSVAFDGAALRPFGERCNDDGACREEAGHAGVDAGEVGVLAVEALDRCPHLARVELAA